MVSGVTSPWYWAQVTDRYQTSATARTDSAHTAASRGRRLIFIERDLALAAPWYSQPGLQATGHQRRGAEARGMGTCELAPAPRASLPRGCVSALTRDDLMAAAMAERDRTT